MTVPAAPSAPTERIDRREAILRAAIQVFGRDGYSRASVDEIARLAGVAKATLYSRFSDKATLFIEAVAGAAARSNNRVTDVIDTMDTHPTDLRAELERLGTALVGCVMHAEGATVTRLQMTEHAEFGAEFDKIRVQGRERILDRLAGKLAQLSATGQLRAIDPRRAARHLIALVSDEALARSGYGTSALTRDDVAGQVSDAVETFVAAFGPRT